MGEPQDPYAGQPYQPPYQQYQPPYQQNQQPYPGQPQDAGYPTPGYAGYPGYQPAPGVAPGGYPGYPVYPPQPGAYPGYPYAAATLYLYGRPGRPGMAVASAVLAFISSGMLVIAAILLLATASRLDSVDNNNDFFGFSNAVAELRIDSVLDIVVAALLIVAGVQLLNRKPIGWLLTLIGNGLVVAVSIYWVLRTHEDPGAVGWAIVFAALAVISGALVVPTSVRQWTRPQLS